jgi:chromosome partitioning protein
MQSREIALLRKGILAEKGGTVGGRIFAVAMQKGGVAKTTTVANLGANLARRGARVLAIDLDPQANLTRALGVETSELEYSSYEVLLHPEHGFAFATVQTAFGVDLVPAVLNLAAAEVGLASAIARELRLRNALTKGQAREQYDFIFIDTPPSLGLFTLNALTAADVVLVPLQLQVYAYEALGNLEATIELVRQLNPDLQIGGIICTMADRRTTLARVVEDQARAAYGDLVFQTTIPLNTKLAEAPSAGEPISTYAPNSLGAQAYAALAAEFEERYAYQ